VSTLPPGNQDGFRSRRTIDCCTELPPRVGGTLRKIYTVVDQTNVKGIVKGFCWWSHGLLAYSSGNDEKVASKNIPNSRLERKK